MNNIDVEKIRGWLEKGKEIAETLEQEQNDPISIVCNGEALQGVFNEALALLPKLDKNWIATDEHRKKFDEYQDVVHSLLRYLQAKGDVVGTGDTCDDIKRKIFLLLPKPCEKMFNCNHFRSYSQSVPIPFGPGSCSEPLGDCAIESESEDCCLECPDYEETKKPCSECGGSQRIKEKSHSRPILGGIMKATGEFIKEVPCPACCGKPCNEYGGKGNSSQEETGKEIGI